MNYEFCFSAYKLSMPCCIVIACQNVEGTMHVGSVSRVVGEILKWREQPHHSNLSAVVYELVEHILYTIYKEYVVCLIYNFNWV